MNLLDRLNAKYGRYAVPNLTLFLIAGQVLAYVANAAPRAKGAESLIANITLVPGKVLSGEWWRVITFLFAPPPIHLLFVFFFWYLFYLMGTTLEAQWGSLRYNLYLLCGYVASVAMAFVAAFVAGVPGETASNAFLYATVFLAFAKLYPDFVMYIMFVLPVKIRWLAILTWIMLGVTLAFSQSWLERAMVFAAVFNYLLFFGRDIWRDMQRGQRRMKFQSRSLSGNGNKGQPRIKHECHVCGLSSETSPRTQFRYCTECGGALCYCPEHLANHEHVRKENQPA